MECSENVYMTDFDRLNSHTPHNQMNQFRQSIQTPTPQFTNDSLSKRFLNNTRGLDSSKPSTSMRLNVNYDVDTSSSSIVAADSVPSLQDADINGNPITENTVYKSTKIGNVRLDKHVIDTSKFAGYEYKLETKSCISNQYHIKGSLTNQQTGHSLVVQNTKVKTPNLQTKVIIDKL